MKGDLTEKITIEIVERAFFVIFQQVRRDISPVFIRRRRFCWRNNEIRIVKGLR